MQQECWLNLLVRRGFIATYRGNTKKEAAKYACLPLGTVLRRNIVHEWIYNMVTSRENVHLLEGNIISDVRKSSLHLGNLAFVKNYLRDKEEARRHQEERNRPVFRCLLTQECTVSWRVDNKNPRSPREVSSSLRRPQTKLFKTNKLDNNSILPLHVEQGKIVIEARDASQAGEWLKLIKKELAVGARIYRRASKLFLPLAEFNETHLVFQSATDCDVKPMRHYGHVCRDTGHPFLSPVSSTQLDTQSKDASQLEIGTELDVDCEGGSIPGKDHSGGKALGTEDFSTFLIQKSHTGSSSPCQLRTNLTQGLLDYAGVVMETLNISLPFGLASIGPVFRDVSKCDQEHTASPMTSLDEFQQMEMLYFCHSSEVHKAYIHWQKQRLRWWKLYSDDPERFSVEECPREQLLSDEHKSSVIKFQLPWFGSVVETVKSYHPSSDGTSVIRTSAGLDGGFWAFLADAHWNRIPGQYSKLQVLRLNEMLAPFKVAVIPDNPNTENQVLFGRQLSLELKKTEISTRFRHEGAPEDNYIKEDESGTPYCVLVDDNTLNCGVVGFRHRNNGLAEYIHKDDLLHSLFPRLRRYRVFKPS